MSVAVKFRKVVGFFLNRSGFSLCQSFIACKGA